MSIIVVSGFPGSGLGLLARAVHVLTSNDEGTWLGRGRPALQEVYERIDIRAVNFALLRQLGTDWTTFDSRQTKSPALDFGPTMASIVEDLNRSKAPLLIKDSNMALTLDLWWPHLLASNRKVLCLFAYRDHGP